MSDLPAPFRLIRSRLAAAVALLLAGQGVVYAQQTTPPTQAELDAAIRDGQKADKTLPTPGALIGRPPKGGPRVISADNIDAVVEKRVSAIGDVSLTQGNMAVNAERLDYDKETDTAGSHQRLSPGLLDQLNRFRE